MSQHNISTVAHLIAEPVRAVMLITLTDGRARPAGVLANAAGVTAQTASAHLSKLLDGGLLRVENKGRHRYYSLAGPHIPRVLESLASVGPVTRAWRSPVTRGAREMRFARCCYDHLAGQLGVALTRAMLTRGYLAERNEYEYELTPAGHSLLQRIGADTSVAFSDGAVQAHRCLDWTERQYHVSGPLGAQLMDTFCARDWIRRGPETRAVIVTPAGWDALREYFGIEVDDLQASRANSADCSESA